MARGSRPTGRRPRWSPTARTASRNPIYVALTLMYAGIAVLADSAWALALLVPLLAVVRFGVLAREERHLERRFGAAYRAYRAAVRRWI